MKKNGLCLRLLFITAFSSMVTASCGTASTGCPAFTPPTAGSTSECCTPCSTTCSISKNTWLPRAFSSYSSREVILEKDLFQYETGKDEWSGTLSFATEYMQNFGSKCNGSCKNLGALPFWSGTNTMTVGNNDGNAQVDAYQFGLGNVEVDDNGIAGTISLNPKVQHVGADMLLYFTRKKDERGFFFKIHAPIGAMMITPNLTEPNFSEPVAVNYFTQTTSAPAQKISYVWDNTEQDVVSGYPGLNDRWTSMSNAFAGAECSSLCCSTASMPISLQKGRIDGCKQTAIRMADVSATIGYNVAANDKGFLGIGFKATCPTGNVPTGVYALEPIFGRGGLWGVGGEVMGHYRAWENDASTKFCDVWLQGEVLHLVPGRTPNYRSFDLALNGPGSKYLLLQYYQPQSDNTFTPGFLTQAVNVTTLPVISKFAVEGSVALMFDFHHNDWNFGIGGEFWGRSKESLSLSCCSDEPCYNLNNFAVVGRQVSAFDVIANSTTPANTGTVQNVVPLCEPLARICSSQNTITLVGQTSTVPAFPQAPYPTGLADARLATNRINADPNVALNVCGAAASKAFTGKVFGQFGYTWSDHRYTPTISVFGGAEFTNCTDNAVQLWSAGLQGALNF